MLEQVASFGNDGLGVAAPFASAGIGYHAIGTVVLTSTHDGYVGRNAIAPQSHGFDVGIGLGSAQLGLCGFGAGGAHAGQQLGQPAVGVGSYHEADILFLYHQLALQPFGHAAQYADAHLLVPLLQRPEFMEAFADTLFGIVAYGAGVDEDIVGRFDVGDDGVVCFGEQGCHNLAVGEIHLASVGFNVY